MAKNFFGHEIARTDAKALPDLLKARFPMGNFLVLTDEESAAVFEPLLKRLPKKLFAVWREGDDLLPLFSEPDKITCAVGIGGGIPAARYFAAVRSLPCAAVCPSFAPCGAGGGEICVTVAGEKTRFPVPLPNLIAFCEPADGRGLGGRARLSLPLRRPNLCLFRLPQAGRRGRGKGRGGRKGEKQRKRGGTVSPFPRGGGLQGDGGRNPLFRPSDGRILPVPRVGRRSVRPCPPGKKVRPPFPRGHVSVLRPRVCRALRPLFRERISSLRKGRL